MATLYEWNRELAWWFVDREEVNQRESRLRLTDHDLYKIGERLGVDRQDCVEDFIKSMFNSNDDVYNRLKPRTIGDNPARIFSYAEKLAREYQKWIQDDDVATPNDEEYPDIVPPFLSHFAFCTLAIYMESGTNETQIYRRISKFLCDSLPDLKLDEEDVKKHLQKDYSVDSWPQGLARKSIKSNDGGNIENIWTHVGRWSRDRAESRGDGGTIRTIPGRYGSWVNPIRYAAQIRPHDQKIFERIAKQLDPNYLPSRDSMRAKINGQRYSFRAGVKRLIENGLFEGLIDHGLQTWALAAPGDNPDEQRAGAAGVEVRYQLEPYLWISKGVVDYASIRIRHIKGKAEDDKLIIEGDGFSHEISAPKGGGVSDPMPEENAVNIGRIWRGEFTLKGNSTGSEYGFNSVSDSLRKAPILLVPDHQGMWHPGEPVVGQRSAVMARSSDGEDSMLSLLDGSSVGLRMQAGLAGTRIKAQETNVSFSGGLKLTTGEYLRRAPPVLKVTRGSPEHVDLFPEGGGVIWSEFLIEEPGEPVEGVWKFVPRDDVSSIRIEYKIGNDVEVVKEIQVTDGVDLWRGYRPEIGRGEGA